VVGGRRSELDYQVETGPASHGVVLETGPKKEEDISSIPGVLCLSTKKTMNFTLEGVVIKLG